MAHSVLHQIVWEEVRNYRLAQKAELLKEFEVVKTYTNKSGTQPKTAAATSSTKTPFKNAQDAQKFYDWVAKTYSGGVVGVTAKPNDPKLINLYTKYKKEYADTQTVQKKLSSTAPSPEVIPGSGITAEDLVKYSLAAGALLVGGGLLKKLFGKKGSLVPKQPGAQGKFWRRLANEMVRTADDGSVVQIMTDRNWFRTKFTNLLRINKREVNRVLNDIGQDASQITDNDWLEVASAIGKKFADKQAFIAAKRSLLNEVVKDLNSGNVPQYDMLWFLDWLHGDERKYIPLIRQRWQAVSKKAVKAQARANP